MGENSLSFEPGMITAENIAGLFREFKVPQEVDYVSIDIDSCDVYVFYALVSSEFRPRVLTVEYNSNFHYNDFTTRKCGPNVDSSWHNDNLYGASLEAVNLAARKKGYTPVYIAPDLDVFLVRDDLLCPNSGMALSELAGPDGGAVLGHPFHPPYRGERGPKENLVADFGKWVKGPQAHDLDEQQKHARTEPHAMAHDVSAAEVVGFRRAIVDDRASIDAADDPEEVVQQEK